MIPLYIIKYINVLQTLSFMPQIIPSPVTSFPYTMSRDILSPSVQELRICHVKPEQSRNESSVDRNCNIRGFADNSSLFTCKTLPRRLNLCVLSVTHSRHRHGPC